MILFVFNRNKNKKLWFWIH